MVTNPPSPVECAVTESTDGKPGGATNGWAACNDGVTTVAGMLKGGSVEDTSEADTRAELSVTN